MEDLEQEHKAEACKPPWWRMFVGRPVPIVAPIPNYQDQELGFITTGDEALHDIVNYVRDRRNVMLVGPRGTGKSWMARKAVKAIEMDPEFGVVAVITLQGDPNKPPSDYFDDGIIFSVETASGTKRVIPDTVKAPFFSHAQRISASLGFIRDENGRLILFRKIDENKELSEDNRMRVDRLVVFWDEGNRSSPAMQNAMLSLLAEGIIRRDGIDYVFPPVSCILTRNPDGYDAQSAKMPSPLIDRFGVQLYVYNPDVVTMREVITPRWHGDLLFDLKTETLNALQRLRQSLPADLQTGFSWIPAFADALEQEFAAERIWEKEKEKKGPRPTSARNLDFCRTRLLHLEKLEFYWCDRFHHPLANDLPVPIDRRREWVRHARNALLRLACCPTVEAVQEDAKRISLAILSTWGKNLDPVEKAGMQYLPEPMRKGLDSMASKFPAIASAQGTLGRLTRYGTSIRAQVDLLETLCGAAMRKAVKRTENAKEDSKVGGAPPMPPAGERYLPEPTDIEEIVSNLGRLLNHRCEPSFNPDREPEKARRKTAATIQIAQVLLSATNKDEVNKLYDELAAEWKEATRAKGEARQDAVGERSQDGGVPAPVIFAETK